MFMPSQHLKTISTCLFSTKPFSNFSGLKILLLVNSLSLEKWVLKSFKINNWNSNTRFNLQIVYKCYKMKWKCHLLNKLISVKISSYPPRKLIYKNLWDIEAHKSFCAIFRQGCKLLLKILENLYWLISISSTDGSII